MGNTTLADGGANETAVCFLTDSAAGQIGQSYTSTDATNDAQQSLSIVAPLTSTGTTVDVDCLSSDAGTSAYYTHLTVIKVGAVTGNAGHHQSGKTLDPTVTK